MVEELTLINIETNQRIYMDMDISEDYILGTVDWGSIVGTHHPHKFVNQIGESNGNTTLGIREVRIEGWVIADEGMAMEQKKKRLNSFVNPMQPIRLIYRKYCLEFYPNSTIQYSSSAQDNNDVVCKFKMEGTAFDPLFVDSVESRVSASSTLGAFKFPLSISRIPSPPGGVLMGVKRSSVLFNIYNQGDVETGFKILLRAKGRVVNPEIINVNTQQFFRINKTLVSGEEIEIHTSIGHKKVIGRKYGKEENYYPYRDINNTWFQLRIGDNVYKYNAQENIENLEVFVDFRNKYLEVEGC